MLSPRNSRRSYDSDRSVTLDGCMNTCASRSAGSASISETRSAEAAGSLLVLGDVVDGLPDGHELLGILVRDLDPELVLELHDQLDEVERVRVEVVLKRRSLRHVALLHAELLHQH